METEFPLTIHREQRHSDPRSDATNHERGFENLINEVEPRAARTLKKITEEECLDGEQAEEPSAEVPELAMIGPIILELLDLVKANQNPQCGTQGKNLREFTKSRNKIPLPGQDKTTSVQPDALRQATHRETPSAITTPETPLSPSTKLSNHLPLNGMQTSLESHMRPGNTMPTPVSGSSSPTSHTGVPQDLEVRLLRATAEGGETRMKVRLADGDVVDLKLSVKDSVANVTLRTTRPEMVKLLQESIHELVADLESHGLEVGIDLEYEPQDDGEKQSLAHFVQNQNENEGNANQEDDAKNKPVSKPEPAWHYLTIRGRVYVVA